MFKVKFIRQIHSCCSAVSSTDIFIERLFILPFVPFVGMSISDGDFDEKIEELYWDNKAKIFKAYVSPDKILYDVKNIFAIDGDRRVLEIAKEYAHNSGWSIPQRYLKRFNKA